MILIETVGVGQAELDIAALADTTLGLLAPGMGDGIQAAKAGILEFADVFVVNKADREGASTVVRQLRSVLSLGDRRSAAGWDVPIVSTVASRGEGVEEVVEAIERHSSWLASSGVLGGGRIWRRGLAHHRRWAVPLRRAGDDDSVCRRALECRRSGSDLVAQPGSNDE